jgi:hypothetical protein
MLHFSLCARFVHEVDLIRISQCARRSKYNYLVEASFYLQSSGSIRHKPIRPSFHHSFVHDIELKIATLVDHFQ